MYKYHSNQVDKSGLPYVFHPFHLAEQMEDEAAVCTALLHDVVEDTDYTLEDLRQMGFDEVVLGALTLLTHDPAVPYMEYVAAIGRDPVARVVKLADLRHNSDLTRLETITEEDRLRAEKYKAAMALLESLSVKE